MLKKIEDINEKDAVIFLNNIDVVVIVDMQPDFLKSLRSSELDLIIKNQIVMLDACADLKIPVIVLELGEGRNGRTCRSLLNITGVKYTIMSKDSNDGFYKTKLLLRIKKLALKKKNPIELLFMGINADYCVRSTVISALKHGLGVTVCENAISGQKWHSTDNSVGFFLSQGCKIV